MNLVKELKKTALENHHRQLQSAKDALDSVKANLGMQDTEDAEMLKYFGTDTVIVQQSAKKSDVIKMIDGEFLTDQNIKSVCIKYNLRFLQSSFYQKEIPLVVLNDLRKYKLENNLSDEDISNGLFVIAPPEHFILGPRPSKDPVLIFKEKENVFRVLSKWGNDFNSTRRLSGVYHNNPNIIWILGSALVLNIIGTVIYFLFDTREGFALNGLLVMWMFMSLEDGISTTEEIWNKPIK